MRVMLFGATGQRHPKLHDLVHPDLLDLAPIEGELTGYDACFFCLGVSSAGMDEETYRRVTLAHSPDLAFVYVSGQGTGRGGSIWARVKGETVNALLALPFHAYMLRPGYIQPMHGIRSKTRWYRMAYAVTAPLYPVLRRLFPRSLTTTEQVDRCSRISPAGSRTGKSATKPPLTCANVALERMYE